jgi:dTDP-4-amino-4,6-dideoxygalactose transaminase
MHVPLLDLKSQYQSIRTEILERVNKVFDSQYFILGPEVEALENAVAQYCQSDFAVGVSSGTDALLISLMASGIGQGDYVITSPYTFFATAGAIARAGAKPLFVDIEPESYNLDPQALRAALETMGSEQRDSVKAIVPVHLYGQCADMGDILSIANDLGLTVIEDAAQAIGAEWQNRRAGSMGHYGCFSFFPSKNLGAFGDGGIVTTSSQERCERLRRLRVHGSHPKYYHGMIGGNFRLDALQAAVVAVKLNHLDAWTEKRQINAHRYRTLFQEAGLLNVVRLPRESSGRHIYNQFVINVKGDRDRLKVHLQENEIGTEIYYPVPLHLQRCFQYLGYQPGDLPISERAAQHTLALPVYPELSGEQQHYVVEQIAHFFRRNR